MAECWRMGNGVTEQSGECVHATASCERAPLMQVCCEAAGHRWNLGSVVLHGDALLYYGHDMIS